MKKILSLFFLSTLLTLLIAARFGFTWAGGNGYETPLSASVEIFSPTASLTLNLSRGQIIETADLEKAIVYIGETPVLALDERTSVSLESLLPSKVEIKIIRGRLLAKPSDEIEKLIISSPEASDFITSGRLTAVRYDWLGKTEITPFEKFAWENSNAKEFYTWSLSKLK